MLKTAVFSWVLNTTYALKRSVKNWILHDDKLLRMTSHFLSDDVTLPVRCCSFDKAFVTRAWNRSDDDLLFCPQYRNFKSLSDDVTLPVGCCSFDEAFVTRAWNRFDDDLLFHPQYRNFKSFFMTTALKKTSDILFYQIDKKCLWEII